MGIEDLRTKHAFPSVMPDVEPNTHGWLVPESELVLARLIYPDDKVLLELGSWMGKSARFMADQAPGAVIICVDHWDAKRTMPEARQYPSRQYDRFVRSCWEYRERLLPLRMKTSDGIRAVRDAGISPDLTFIDAGHGPGEARKDLEDVLDSFPASAIVGDDWHLKTVRADVIAVAEERGIGFGFLGNCWWVDDRWPRFPSV